MKKGYYIRRVKDSLWSVFGIQRIKPFGDNYCKYINSNHVQQEACTIKNLLFLFKIFLAKDQMKAWKSSDEVNKVHDDLYNPNDPSDVLSEGSFGLYRSSWTLLTSLLDFQAFIWSFAKKILNKNNKFLIVQASY